MKTAAIIANLGLLLAITIYLASMEQLSVELRELPLFTLMFASPILSTMALAKSRKQTLEKVDKMLAS